MNYLRNNTTGAQYNFDSAPMNQNALALDYSSPIEIGGVGKGYRLKNDPFSAVLADVAPFKWALILKPLKSYSLHN